MPERIDWLEDGSAGGTPFSPRFGDRYRSELGGLDQARDVFLKGCGLPAAWKGERQWRVLETGFGLGLNFLVTWRAWKDDPDRPTHLHFISTEAFPATGDDLCRSAEAHPELQALAAELKAQFWGLLPGFHRLSFEDGRVLLTLCIGDAKAMLKQQAFEADSVYLDGFSPQKNPDIWDIHTMKAVARCCRRGTRIATWTIARSVRDALSEAGFQVHKTPGIPPKRDNLQGEYNPAWTPQKPPALLGTVAARTPGHCLVIGAGLAGAAAAASLARRGWTVTVLDAASEPAAGASGLPAGLVAPHVSPDDAPVSRLSRCGLRITVQQASALLKEAVDWAPTGVLENRLDDQSDWHATWQGDWADAADDWSRAATPAQRAACDLPGKTSAWWHPRGAWLKPASLVRAWLATPGIEWRGSSAVSALQRTKGQWQVLDGHGKALAQGDLVVVAAAHGSVALGMNISWSAAGPAGDTHSVEAMHPPLALQPLRGQLTWRRRDADASGALPPFPVNGHGSLIPSVPLNGQPAWITGATFERGESRPLIRPADALANLDKLAVLLPNTAAHLRASNVSGDWQHWAGVRCATPVRLPVLTTMERPGTRSGEADESAGTLWLSSGMGSRGLCFAALCGELLAARLHGEPLPVELRLAAALDQAATARTASVPRKKPSSPE
ncbi:MAG: FAD-dependent 5-carboxymethylaminomethyl-2-thiouridine(34) oxidoreductase MnmC [Polaromonas sp.]|nr:FAD-dependent 5-carboxymethylaminomethyl-2-thiouridine(34) oxidoreductase MnmC [Polaromonas sp.]